MLFVPLWAATNKELVVGELDGKSHQTEAYPPVSVSVEIEVDKRLFVETASCPEVLVTLKVTGAFVNTTPLRVT